MTCVSCRRPADTPYCPHCGERRAGDRPLHVRELVEELWGAFVSVDGRVVRSFWTLLRYPGALTAAYVRGERRRYLTPLGVFFTVNALFFLFATAYGVQGITAPLHEHLTEFSHHAIAQRLVSARLAERHVSLAAYERAFDAVASNQGKTLLLALVPMFAACVALVQLPGRRPALQHVAFALHAVSVWFITAMATFFGLVYGVPRVAHAVLWARHWVTHRPIAWSYRWGDDVFAPALGALFFLWIVPALRRNYGGGWVANGVRGAALAYAIFPVLWTYRALLFFTAYWAT